MSDIAELIERLKDPMQFTWDMRIETAVALEQQQATIDELEDENESLQLAEFYGLGQIRALHARIEDLQAQVAEYKDAECRAVKLHGEALVQVAALEGREEEWVRIVNAWEARCEKLMEDKC